MNSTPLSLAASRQVKNYGGLTKSVSKRKERKYENKKIWTKIYKYVNNNMLLCNITTRVNIRCIHL